jgi:hypothetical protein
MHLVRFASPAPPLPPIKTKLTFYIIFHRDVLPENTRDYTLDELRERFLWVSVNDAIPKSIPADFPCLAERSFPTYVPDLQATNFYQNSVFFHLFWNPSFLTSEFVGFGQYDMEITKQEFETSLSLLTSPRVVVSFMSHTFADTPQVYGPTMWGTMFMRPYNVFRHKNHQFKDLESYPMCLYHTFILPRWLFVEMMEFADWNLPNLRRCTKYDTRHLAGTLERVFAFYIACAAREGRIDIYEGKGVVNRLDQRIVDPFRGLPGRT